VTHTVEVPDYEVQRGVRVDPSRTALIVGDMQNDFVTEPGTLVVPSAEGTIPAILNLLELARESGMKVVFVQDTHHDGDPEWEIWGEHCREGSWGWQVVDGLAPNEDEATIRKPRYDAFYGTGLEHMLRLWGVDTLIICGTVANICVHYTASSAAMRWFNVIVPRDCISSFNDFDAGPDGHPPRGGHKQRVHSHRRSGARGDLHEQAGRGRRPRTRRELGRPQQKIRAPEQRVSSVGIRRNRCIGGMYG
jgi:nicotinamidase-related amidase